MISLDRLGCRAYGAQALKRRSVKIHRSQPTCRQHQRTEVQPEVHRNALDSKVLQKTPVLAMAQAQACHRSRKCTKVASEPLNRGLESVPKMRFFHAAPVARFRIARTSDCEPEF